MESGWGWSVGVAMEWLVSGWEWLRVVSGSIVTLYIIYGGSG